MKILILGGTGAMGCSLVSILAENHKNEIYVTSRSVRKSIGNEQYIQGNARDVFFMKQVLMENNYDVIVDFMRYTPDEFKDRVEMLLSATKQYVFLSSCRVYADAGDNKIVEDTPRLLDVCADAEHLATNEYALEKAREENVLFDSSYTNWTIVRPYITYNDNRLQLGILEKENWLYRALNHQTIVFPKDIADKYTTLTYGYDVAKVLAGLLLNEKAFGQVFNIVTEQTIKWKDVLDLYLNVIENELQYRPKVFMPDNSKEIGEVCGCKYQLSCDRLYNRAFLNDKVDWALGHEISYTDVKKGLTQCLTNFIRSNKSLLNNGMSVRQAAYYDKLVGERSSLKCFSTFSHKVAYLFLRYMPFKFSKR